MGPAARLSFGWHLWLAARLQPWEARKRPMEALLAAATPPPGPAPYRGLPAAEIIESVRRVVAQPWLMRDRRCLRASLLAFRFLRLAAFRRSFTSPSRRRHPICCAPIAG